MWFLPSRKRLGRLAEFFEIALGSGLSTPGVVLVNEDDSTTYEAMKLPEGWAVERVKGDCTADCYRHAFDKWSDLKWYGILSDDCAPRTEGFDVLLIRAAGRTRIASANDLKKSPRRIGPCAVFGGDLVRAMGGLVPDGFKHRYVDDVWEDMGRDLNIWTPRMDVVVEHLHPFFGKAEMDETYARAYAFPDDQRCFTDWRNTKKAEVYEAVRAIQ